MKETQYPIIFDKCPTCGSTECVVETEVADEIERGNLPSDMKIPALITESHLIDTRVPLKETKKFNALVSYYDICANCGNLYCKQIRRVTGTATPRPKPGPQILRPPDTFMGGSPFIGRG